MKKLENLKKIADANLHKLDMSTESKEKLKNQCLLKELRNLNLGPLQVFQL